MHLPSRVHAAAMAACLAALCCCAPLAAADSTGTSVMGYNFTSDVTGYLEISQDVCDIMDAIESGNFTLAYTIYTSGLNSLRGNGEARTLQSWAMPEGERREAHWDLYVAHFNDSTWLNSFIEGTGFEGAGAYTSEAARAQIVMKGIQSNLQAAHMWHEIDEGTQEIEAGGIAAAGGVSHKVDEAAAVYFGTACTDGNIARVADKRANTFGTLALADDGTTCTAATNLAVSTAFQAMQAAAMEGDAAAYATAAMALDKAIITIYTQATLTYAHKLEEIVPTGEPTDEDAAEGLAFFRTIEPLVAQVSAEDAAAIVDAFAAPAAGIEAAVTAAMKETLAAYGITAADLGTYGATSPCY